MKSRCEIWLSALEELGALCSVSTTRDAVSITRRIENEGEAFFTKTLPSYAKDLERSLDAGEIPSWLYSSWTRRRLDVTVEYPGGGSKLKKWSSRGAPVFLGGFMDIVFDSSPVMSDEEYELVSQSPSLLAPRMRCTSDEADVARMASAIYAIRQLSLMFSKERDLCSDELVEAAIEKYVLLDSEMIHPLSMAAKIASLETVFFTRHDG